MNPHHPSVSVIIPVFNGARYLEAALASVLAQSYPPSEIIAVDDGSDDDSGTLIERIAASAPTPIRYLHQHQRGPGAARNRGFVASTGEIIAFLDQDDLWVASKLQQQVRLFQADAALGIVLAHQIYFLDAGFARPAWVRPELLEKATLALTPSALAVRRDAFAQIGGFNEEMLLWSDTDWFFRAQDAGVPLAYAPEVLVQHRIHTQNQSRMATRFHQELLGLVQQSIRRKQTRHVPGEGTKERR
jgi:glycosyltransferase involved in cell wall biosynthesis